MGILAQLIGQFKLLQYNVKNIRHMAFESVKAHKLRVYKQTCHAGKLFDDSDLSRKPSYLTAIWEETVLNEMLAELRHDDDVHNHLPVQTFCGTAAVLELNQEKILPTNKEVNTEMKHLLKECIKHHQKLYR